MPTGTNVSDIHSEGLVKRSDIKTRPPAHNTVAALEPEAKAYRERDSNGLYLRHHPFFCFLASAFKTLHAVSAKKVRSFKITATKNHLPL